MTEHATEAEGAAEREGDDREGRRWLPWVPVVVCALIVLVLGVLKVSGSSVSLYGSGNRPEAGQPRIIRSDEFLTRTPLVVRQAALDFPATTQLGVGVHRTGVLSDLPVASWTTVLRPQTVPYFLVDVERAFALEWWIVLAAPFLGVYALVLVLTRRVGLATLTGAAVALSPVALWWAIPTMGMSIGSSAACAAALIAAGGARRRWVTIVWSVIAGYAAACLLAVLYVPWILPMGALAAGAVAGVWLGRSDRPPRVQLLTVSLITATTSAALMAAFTLRERSALQAIATSAYPGNRRSLAGEGNLPTLLSGPFDVLIGEPAAAIINGANQSEVAVGLMLWIPILLADGTLWSWRCSDQRERRVVSMMMLVLLVCFAWCLLPVPSWIGALTGLDRIVASRMYFPLSIGGVVVAALYAHARQADRAARPSTTDLSARRIRLAVGVFLALTLWAGLSMRIDGNPVSRTSVTLLSLAATLVVLLVLVGRPVGAVAALVALTAFSTLRINPVQIGLDPLLNAPVARQIDRIEAERPELDGRWLLDGTDADAVGPLVASGAPTVSGLSWYADDDAWLVLDPDRSAETVWNRLGRVEFDLVDGDVEPTFANPIPDAISIRIGVCRPEIIALGVDVIAAQEPLTAPCLRQALPNPAGPDEVWVYEVVPDR